MKKQNSKVFKIIFFPLFLLLGINISSNAKIKLASIFTDNMVLQQNTDAPLWGNASPEKLVTVTTSWDNKFYQLTSKKDGSWNIKVKTPEAGFKPYTITFSDGNLIQLKNVLIGEVWICSGQSNMELPLASWGKINNYEEEIANANYPNIRLLHISKITSTIPLDEVKIENVGWIECSPVSIPNFSSVAYFFGRDLLKSLNLPIGLINVSWGGTIAEAWTSKASLVTMPDFMNSIPKEENLGIVNEEKDYKLKFDEWERKLLEVDKGYKSGIPVWNSIKFDDSSWKAMYLPGIWEEKGLPDFDGIVWFRKIITIPKAWNGKELKISLGEIDDNDVTFFNGVQIGATVGWNVTRTYTVPAKLVKTGNAVITVKVIDARNNGGIYGEAKNLYASSVDKTKLSLTGDWKYNIGADIKDLPVEPKSEFNNLNRPTVLFNAMIKPLVPYAMRGAIWYQGESNSDRAYQYRELFPLMIQDWRKQWNTEFPFYFVQLANYMKADEEPMESAWAELREAQSNTLHLENTGMAVTIDIGDAKDIHAKNKQEVGRRLSLVARANTYGENIAFSGPIFKSYKIVGTKIHIGFEQTQGGLKTKNDETLKGFAIAGVDHKFYWANAEIVGAEIIVSSPEVSFPIAVRYAWANNPDCNLTNGAGLPASPFRTDDWVGMTFRKK